MALPSTQTHPEFSAALHKLQRRVHKLRHNEMVLNNNDDDDANGATPAVPVWLFEPYLKPYADAIVDETTRGQSTLLMGLPGTGKTAVMQQVRACIEQNQTAKCVFVNIHDNHTHIRPKELLALMVGALHHPDKAAEAEQYDDAEGWLRRCIHDWMRTTRQDVVLLLDQVEMLEHEQEIQMVLRNIYMQQENYAAQNDAGARFVMVLSSTKALQHRYSSDTSPLHNILKVVEMRECPPEISAAFWNTLFRDVSERERAVLIRQLDWLCGNDPHQINSVAQLLKPAIEQRVSSYAHLPISINSGGVANSPIELSNQLFRSLTLLISEARSTPTQHAPYLKRYAELLEDDLDALALLVRLAAGEKASTKSVRAKTDRRSAAVWQGVFARQKGFWDWRSELTKLYLMREFIYEPQRLTRSLRRKRLYHLALHHLLSFRHHSKVETLQLLQDVITDWIGAQPAPQEGWAMFAHALAEWCDGENRVQVYRFYGYRSNEQNELGAYFRTGADQSEEKATPQMTALLKQAHAIRVQRAHADEIAYDHVLLTEADGATQWVIFPLIKERREFGAIVLTMDAYVREQDGADNQRDQAERWTELFNNAALELVKLQERQELREALANSLKIEDYELVEEEYSHQWNKRIREMRDLAAWSVEDLDEQGHDAIPEVKKRLERITGIAKDAIERLRFNSKFYDVQEAAINQCLKDLVDKWNLFNEHRGGVCQFETAVDDHAMFSTRPIILDWIVSELLTNALEAEERANNDTKNIRVLAHMNKLANDESEIVIRVSNPTPMPSNILEQLLAGNPLEREMRSGHGRGVWLASGQVRSLLSGKLTLPKLNDTSTTITITLPKQIG